MKCIYERDKLKVPVFSQIFPTDGTGNIVERTVIHCNNNQDFQEWLEQLNRLTRGPASCSSLSKTSSSSCSAHSVSRSFVLTSDSWGFCHTLPVKCLQEAASTPFVSGESVFVDSEVQLNLTNSNFSLWGLSNLIRCHLEASHLVWQYSVTPTNC